jgi:hypothetical protein
MKGSEMNTNNTVDQFDPNTGMVPCEPEVFDGGVAPALHAANLAVDTPHGGIFDGDKVAALEAALVQSQADLAKAFETNNTLERQINNAAAHSAMLTGVLEPLVVHVAHSDAIYNVVSDRIADAFSDPSQINGIADCVIDSQRMEREFERVWENADYEMVVDGLVDTRGFSRAVYDIIDRCDFSDIARDVVDTSVFGDAVDEKVDAAIDQLSGDVDERIERAVQTAIDESKPSDTYIADQVIAVIGRLISREEMADLLFLGMKRHLLNEAAIKVDPPTMEELYPNQDQQAAVEASPLDHTETFDPAFPKI